MKHQPWLVVFMAAFFLISNGFERASAELPILKKQPWIGYFAVFENRDCQFSVDTNGVAYLTLMNPKGEPMGEATKIAVSFVVEEILPNGETRLKKIKKGSLESTDPATDKLGKITFHGKVTGDAAFEVIIEQERGDVFIGGRITDTGTLTKAPLRFTVRVKVPNVYAEVEKEGRMALKIFEKRIKDDHLDLKWTDGKRLKQNFTDRVDVTSKEINGPGIANAEAEINYYNGKKLRFAATEGSAFTLWNDTPAPLHEGFTVNWVVDAAKDPTGKSRLSLQVK
jgi:hypothetical protein